MNQPARLDPNGTELPLTRIVAHPRAGWCFGHGMPLRRPEYEAEDGTRTALNAEPVKAKRHSYYSTLVVFLEKYAESAQKLGLSEQDFIDAAKEAFSRQL